MSEIVLTLDDPFRPEALALADEFWLYLGEIYGDEGENRLNPAHLVGEGAAFILVWQDGKAVGCGAVRPLADDPSGETGELKRIFVTASARRQGISRLLMARLQEEAKRLGYKRLCLETGTPQFEAVALYESDGWHRITTYGEYADDPLSVCYGKELIYTNGV